jgi:translation elongation factor EF-4
MDYNSLSTGQAIWLKLQILLNEEPVDALTAIVPQNRMLFTKVRPWSANTRHHS